MVFKTLIRYLLVFSMVLSGAGSHGLCTNLAPMLKGGVTFSDKTPAKIRQSSTAPEKSSFNAPSTESFQEAERPAPINELDVSPVPPHLELPARGGIHLQVHSGQSPPDITRNG